MNEFLIYGANGYTGSLIAQEAVKQGLRPILAGRKGPAVRELAERLGLDHSVVALEQSAALEDALRKVHTVLHCAGPFAHTSGPMVEACLRTGTHYLDITGEIGVFESIARRAGEAREKGVMLLPGVGFDVVPSDCLALHLKQRLPSATRLALAIASNSRMSRGTAKTVVENIHRGGLIRQGGELKKVPTAWKTRTIDFGAGPVKAITIPWGDVATAWYSTGIPDIEVYMAAPAGTRLAARLLRSLGWLVGASLVQRFLKKRIQSGPAGPSEQERAQGRSLLWGEATDDAGRRVVSRLTGPEGYTFTVLAALAVLRRVLDGQAPAGFQTPARAYGPDLVLELPGVRRTEGHG